MDEARLINRSRTIASARLLVAMGKIVGAVPTGYVALVSNEVGECKVRPPAKDFYAERLASIPTDSLQGKSAIATVLADMSLGPKT